MRYGVKLRYILLFVLTMLLAGCGELPAVLDDPESLRKTAGAFVATFDAPSGGAEISQNQAEPGPGSPEVVGTAPAPLPGVTAADPVLKTGTPPAHNQPVDTGNCNLAAAGNPVDVTIPDGSLLVPGQYFNKTWRLVNAGTCEWTQAYAVVWFSGESFGSRPVQPLRVHANPGESIEISIDLVAPGSPGQYQGYWKLMSPEGRLFGIGPNGDAPFWVKAQVMRVETETPAPSPTAVPTTQVVATGEMALSPGNMLDLDTGTLDPGKGDLLLELSQNGDLLLVPQNQTSLVFFGPNQPVEWECRLGFFSAAPLELKTIKDGSHICFRSSQGLPGFIAVNTQRYSERILDVRFVTWFAP